MSRNIILFNENTRLAAGNDHAIGSFFDITDKRYAGHQDDEQGEGYIMEFSSLFGFTTNLIGATLEDLQSEASLYQKIENFILSLPPKV